MAHIKVKVYKFKQLSDKAKDRVRQWYAEGLNYYDWWDFVYNQFIEEMSEYGIGISAKDIHFSGFWSQGDGASFSCQMGDTDIIKYLKAHKLTKKYWLLYVNLIRDNVSTGYTVKEYGRYYGMTGEMDTLRVYSDRIIDSADLYNRLHDQAMALGCDILEYCQDRAADLYKQLEKEYEYMISDESIKESCKINGYRFTVDGRIV